MFTKLTATNTEHFKELEKIVSQINEVNKNMVDRASISPSGAIEVHMGDGSEQGFKRPESLSLYYIMLEDNGVVSLVLKKESQIITVELNQATFNKLWL